MLVGFCLFIMGVLTVLQIVIGGDWVGVTQEAVTSNQTTLNGTTTTLEMQSTDFVFGISAVDGFLGTLIVIIIIASIFGIQVLGSGLSDTTVKVITYAVVYGGVWGVLSVLSYSLIRQIAIFGPVIYIVLTITYVVGVIKNLLGSEG